MSMSGLVPARFLTLTAHLVLLISILWDEVEEKSYETRSMDVDLVIGLSVALGLLIVEFVGFLGGFSMFLPSQGLLSTAAHAGATVTLVYFFFDNWETYTFWWIFGFCSALPAVCEILALVGAALFNKGL